MTVLLAAKQGNKVVLASDRQWSCFHWSGEVCKQFEKRGIVFAGCGPLSEIQPIMNLLSIPPRNEDQNDDSYMYTIADTIRTFMINRLDNKKLEFIKASFIIVSKIGIYNISPCFDVCKYENVCTDGSGCDVALGAFHALKDYEEDLEVRCRKSVEIVNENTLFCGKGVDLKVIELKEGE